MNNSLLKALKDIRTITIRNKAYDLLKIFQIDTNNLSRVFSEHAELAAFWLRMRSRELARLRKYEDALKNLEDEMFISYWNYFTEKNTPFSDSLIRSYVGSDEKVLLKRKEVQGIRRVYNDLDAVCTALEHRKMCLVQVGAQVRHDYENSDSIVLKKRRSNG